MKNQEQDRSALFEKLGGEQFLQEKYPAVYEGLLKGQEKLLKNDGMEDTFEVACPGIIMEKNTALQSADGNTENKCLLVSKTYGKFPKGMTYVCMTGELQDENDYTYDSFAVEYEEDGNPVTDTENRLQAYFPDIARMNDVIYRSKGECYASDADGIVYHYTGGDTQGVLVEGQSSIVEEFTITAPKYRDGKDNGNIIVLYDRDPFDSEKNTWDYKFPNNHAQNNKVKTLLNFTGSIKVKEGYQILGFSETGDILELFYTGIDEPNATYHSATGSIKPFFKISSDKRTCEFDYGNGDPDWHCNLDTSAYGASCIQKLYAYFHLTISNKIGIQMPVTFVVEHSTQPGQTYFTSEGNVVFLPYISIRWGCFHKQTRIKMADGSEKPICEIVIGDIVQTGNGQPQRVKQIYSGYEEELICLQTEDGMEMSVTAGHPVRTADGVLRAENIRPQSELVAFDGSRHAVKFAFVCPYDDVVYNLELDEPKELIANGILAGDFVMQNSMPGVKNNRPCTEDGAEAVRQLKLLMRELGIIKD